MRRKVELPGFIRLEVEIQGLRKTLNRKDISPQKRRRCEDRLKEITAYYMGKYTKKKEVVVYG